MKRKAQGLPINVIIIAAISLAVLVVLFYIFTGRVGSFSEGVAKTATCKNTCVSLGMEVVSEGGVGKNDCQEIRQERYVPGTYSDVTGGNVCCCKPKQP